MRRRATTAAAEDKPLTLESLLEKLAEVKAKLGPPPPRLMPSRHAPALGAVPPKSAPRTDDMRQMIDDIGPQKVPIAYEMRTEFGPLIVFNPIHLKD